MAKGAITPEGKNRSHISEVAAAIFPVGNGKDETSKTDPKGEGLRAQTESIPSGGLPQW